MVHYRRARWGARRTFQTEQAIEELSVYDNVAMIHEQSKMTGGSRREDVLGAIEFVKLEVDPYAKVSTLGAAERRLVEVARAVVGKPRLVMLDEPAAGLPDEETAVLRDVIRAIPEHIGALVILVDHDMSLVSACCETTAVLDFGKLSGLGPDPGRAPRRARRAGLSRHRGRCVSVAAPETTATTLSLQGLTVERGGRAVVRDVSIDIRAGEVTALLGPNGAGKSSMVLAVGGVLKPTAGSVMLGDRDLAGRRPEKIRQAGIAIVPEGRRLLPQLTVEDNLRVATYTLPRGDARAARERALDVFPELAQTPRQSSAVSLGWRAADGGACPGAGLPARVSCSSTSCLSDSPRSSSTG